MPKPILFTAVLGAIMASGMVYVLLSAAVRSKGTGFIDRHATASGDCPSNYVHWFGAVTGCSEYGDG